MIGTPNMIVIFLWVLWLTIPMARATLPVVDYSHIAQDAGNEVVNFAKWRRPKSIKRKRKLIRYAHMKILFFKLRERVTRQRFGQFPE